jgi:nitrogen-specific signal transduction histidine kinase/ActR/RegA family two-component response regulator
MTVALAERAGQRLITLCIRDLTDRRLMEERLRQSQKMEAVGRLAGGIAHDFNNLLSVIIGYGDMLRSALTAGGTEARHANEILSAAHRAASLTSQLLAFSRKQVLQPRVLDLNAVVRDMESMLRPLIGESISLVTRLEPNLGRISADPTQIEQVILNLSVNGRDAMPKGGHLVLETCNAILDDAFVREHPGSHAGSYVVLRVSDDGVGMDSETLRHVFEPFFTTKERGRGTGLGLATVYGVVKQSDGYIWLRSRPGEGTLFEIALPRVDAILEPAAEPPLAAIAHHGGETVLLVEDEVALRRMTRETLEDEGYRVLEADSPSEALAIGCTHPGTIEVMLTDVVMPGMNGRELADRLARHRPQMRVVYTSGYPDDALGRQGVLDPRTPFLPKPFTREGLARRLREALDDA